MIPFFFILSGSATTRARARKAKSFEFLLKKFVTFVDECRVEWLEPISASSKPSSFIVYLTDPISSTAKARDSIFKPVEGMVGADHPQTSAF